jgi:hypothetical protein
MLVSTSLLIYVKFEVLVAVSTKSLSSGMWRRVVSCRCGNVKPDKFCYVKCSVERTRCRGEGGDFEIPLKDCGESEPSWMERHDKCLSVSTAPARTPIGNPLRPTHLECKREDLSEWCGRNDTRERISLIIITEFCKLVPVTRRTIRHDSWSVSAND